MCVIRMHAHNQTLELCGVLDVYSSAPILTMVFMEMPDWFGNCQLYFIHGVSAISNVWEYSKK